MDFGSYIKDFIFGLGAAGYIILIINIMEEWSWVAVLSMAVVIGIAALLWVERTL
jgi:hypothetical protein